MADGPVAAWRFLSCLLLILKLVLGLAGSGLSGDRDRGGIPRRVRPPGRGRDGASRSTRSKRCCGRCDCKVATKTRCGSLSAVIAGNDWEEFYEALFGYEAKREARRAVGSQRAGRLAAQVRGLARPGRGLARCGGSPRGAKPTKRRHCGRSRKETCKAWAKTWYRPAAKRSVGHWPWWPPPPRSRNRFAPATARSWSIAPSPGRCAKRPSSRRRFLLDHERGLLPAPTEKRSNLVARAVTMLLGPKVRFLAGAALLAGCIAWMHQNAMISAEHADGTGRGGEVRRCRGHPVPRRGGRRSCPRSGRPADPAARSSRRSSRVARSRLVLWRGRRRLDPDRLVTVSGHPDHAFRDPGRRDPGAITSPLAPGARADSTRALFPSIAGVAILAAGILFGRR